ncbi:hypothetical protein H6G82_00745 [Planktothricoides sp. FACHB-1261]|nr:hypothetical protein [Planktothricoides raciborskii FACHB-1261]
MKSGRGEWPFARTKVVGATSAFARTKEISLFTIHYSTFTIHSSLFTLHSSLHPTPYTDGGPTP